MQLQRYASGLSIGARIDGMYYKEVPEAFKDACIIFEKAYHDIQLWSFLEQYANSWSNLQTELYESSLALSWSLIERDLFNELSNLFAQVPVGEIQKLNSQGIVVRLNSNNENRLRSKLAQNESPMAGQMISILSAHNVQLNGFLPQVKQARNAHQHSGVSVDPQRCRESLAICSEICKKTYSIDLNPRLLSNAHLGITC